MVPSTLLFPVVLTLSLLAFSHALAPGFPYGSKKVRGVNLGGWLVLEPWITPSLFDVTGDPRIIDEWTFCEFQTHVSAKAALVNHWNTFITEDDFVAIAAAGLNHVRLPIGYWAFDVDSGEPYIKGQIPYMMKAVTWARNHGLKLIIDLHGAPGSQNGFDNSGRKVRFPKWHLNHTNVDRTNNVIKTLAGMFKDDAATVPIIAPLNEPAGYYGKDVLDVVRQYWYDSYGNIRYPYGSSRESNTVELIHDAFQPLSYWTGFETPPKYQLVAMDAHYYQIFSDAEVAMSEQQHIKTACSKGPLLSSFHLWTFVGEWTPAMTDCAKYLNGRGAGSRFDGSFPGSTRIGTCNGLTGKASSFSSNYKTFLRKIWEAQVITYEKGSGWLQWTWKVENADEWSYQAGLANGWIPQNPTAFKFPTICD